MKVFNWKTSSDFSLLLDNLRDSEEEISIVVYKTTPLGWYHIGTLQQLFPRQKFVFICKELRIKKILKQYGYRVFSTLQEMNHTLPEGYQIMQENLSRFDYVRFHFLRFISQAIGLKKKFQPRPDIFSVKHSSWYMLVIGIIIILLLMVGIVSLTTPHAVIIITPQAGLQNAVKNVTFVLEDSMSDTQQIPVRKFIFPFELKKTYNVNSYDMTTLARARGTIKIVNLGLGELKLKPQTRFAVDTLVFRTEGWVNVPAAKDSQPGENTISVIAEPVGSDGVLIGKKGNVPENTIFIVPGLPKEYSQDIIVTSVSEFKGGENSFKNIFSQEEYDRIEKIFKNQLIQNARESILSQFGINDEFIPIPIPEAMSTLDVTIESDTDIGGHENRVTFSGKGNFLVYLYQAETLRKTLLDTARAHLLENTESLIEISKTPPDIISVLVKTDDPWSIKATAQIPVQVLYDFSSSPGQKTIQNILSDLLNSDTDRAQKTLLNHPYIKAIDIRLTPFWANNIPNTLDRIYIKVQEVKN